MKNSIVVRPNGAIANVDSIDFQMEMFNRYKLSPTMAETYKFEKRGDSFALVKRAAPIRIFDDGGHLKSVAVVQKTQSEKIRLSATRGKYNDEGRLFDQDCASIEVKEVTPFAVI